MHDSSTSRFPWFRKVDAFSLHTKHIVVRPATKSAMETEAQPLLLEDDEKPDKLMYPQRSKKISRLRSWAVLITTHGVVALLVLLAVTLSPMADLVSHRELWNARARPTIYCKLD